MALSLSSEVIAHKNSLSTNEALLLLLEVNLPSLAEPLRIANNNEDVVWNTHIWQKFGFSLSEISESASGEVPEVSLQLPNTSRAIERYLIEYDLWLKQNTHQPTTCSIYIVSTADLLNPNPIKKYDFEVSDFSTNAYNANFKLTFQNFYTKRFPQNKIRRDSCRWKFGSAECGYAPEVNESCNKTLAACRAFGNSERFGAFPSVGGKFKRVIV